MTDEVIYCEWCGGQIPDEDDAEVCYCGREFCKLSCLHEHWKTDCE